MSRIAILTLGLMLSLSLPGSQDADYRLAAGDEIEISVYQESDLSMKVRLNESGTFNYPYLGAIVARGKTTAELETEITDGLLEDILINPSVHVAIAGYRNFFIGGEVKRPGAYAYQPGLTVKQAITIAGGFTEWASSSKFEILREGTQEQQTAAENTLVRPGDTVTVREGLF